MSEKRQLKRLFSSFWSAGLLFLILVFIAFAFTKGFRSWWRERKHYQELSRQLQELQAEKARLEQELSYFSSEANLGKEAKEVLGLVEPGEQLVVVVPQVSTTAATSGMDSAQNKNWWQRIIERLKR